MKKFMEEALKEAQKAAALGEVPIGAVIVRGGEIVGRGHNMTETAKDPTAHAEIEAIRQAAKNLGGWRLIGCDMYVTAEPCAMCAGAIVWSRIQTLYIGAMDPKAGACGSVFNIVQEKKLNHNVRIETGLLQDQCSNILKEFFKKLRKTKEQEPGAVLSRITNDLDKMAEAFQTGVLKLFTSVGMIAGSLVMMFRFSVLLTVVFLTFMGISLLVTKIVSAKTLRSALERQQRVSDVTALVEEGYSGRVIIKAFNQEGESSHKMHRATEELAEATRKADFMINAINPGLQKASCSSCDHAAACCSTYYHVRVFSVFFTTFYCYLVTKSFYAGDTERRVQGSVEVSCVFQN